MYDEAGNYNEGKVYKVDINVALLMCAHFKNIEITGDVTTEQKATLSVQNVRFSGNVSGLNFTATTGKGLIDFAGVGPKSEITAVGAKVIVRGLKEGSYEGCYTANTLDFYGVDKTLLKNIEVGNATKRAWEEAGRNGTLPSDSLSKLDVKTKADNPLLQKLLDENCPVYG